jgi:hypothetical protein
VIRIYPNERVEVLTVSGEVVIARLRGGWPHEFHVTSLWADSGLRELATTLAAAGGNERTVAAMGCLRAWGREFATRRAETTEAEGRVTAQVLVGLAT